MSRTESVSFQVHPDDEQSQIELMQRFHWSLLSSQEVKTVDNHLERRGDSVYQISNTERYVKLTFSRPLDLPNLNQIRQIEAQFNSLEMPKYPRLFPGSIWLYLFLALFWGAGVVIWLVYFIAGYLPKKKQADQVAQETLATRTRLLAQVEAYA
ncbi:MAG: hypothetical protein KBD01_05760 [Acidobacteria bacterium]|nr:hypothetical protein [Acidobacteriota bacterium]